MSETIHVATEVADVAVRIDGPRGGPPVVLLHGWPDDARTWDEIAEALAADGYRTFAPYLRGFGPTRLHDGVARSGEVAALARDTLRVADALGLERFDLIGHDWGARTGYATAVLAPERLRTLAALAVAYGTNVVGQVMDAAQMRAYWYQWYFATPRGAAHLASDRRGFTRALWTMWSPGWAFTSAAFDATAASFDNPDWVAITLHSYRQRYGFAAPDPIYDDDRAQLDAAPRIAVPTLTLMGEDDGATLPASAQGREALFAGPYRVRVVPGAGHFLHRERVDEVLAELRAHLTNGLRRDARPAHRP